MNTQRITFALLAKYLGDFDASQRYNPGETRLDGIQVIATAQRSDASLEFANINRADNRDGRMQLAILVNGRQIDTIETLRAMGMTCSAGDLENAGDSPTDAAAFEEWIGNFNYFATREAPIPWVFDPRDAAAPALTDEQRRKLKLADDILRYARVLWVALPEPQDGEFLDLLHGHGFRSNNDLSDDYSCDSHMEAHA